MSSAEIYTLLSRATSCASELLEDEVTEFKEYRDVAALHSSKELAEEICALANHQGGMLVIGVRDSSNVQKGQWQDQLVGFPNVDILEAKARIEGKLKGARPLVLKQIEFGGKNFLVVRVTKRPDSLVSTSTGKFYIRDGRSSRPMSPDEVTTAVKQLTNYDWSAEPVDLQVAEATDIASVQGAANDFCMRRGLKAPLDWLKYLEAVGATNNGRLLRGGLLWIGKPECIRALLGNHEFRFTWKRANGELVLNDVWAGNLWDALNRVKSSFAKCNHKHKFEVGPRSFEAPLLDDFAFHEAYLNAIVHRDYSVDGMISVTYSSSRMVITSPGLFYGGVTSQNIGRHEPRHRNKALAKTLMAHNLVDRAGMGVLRMSIGSLKYGRSLPVFEEQFGSVEVSMQAEYFKAAITILSLDNPEYGVPELLILNKVFKNGYCSVTDIQSQLGTNDAWSQLKEAAERLPQVELCGTNNGLFLRVTSQWRKLLEVQTVFRTSAASEKHVKLYEFLVAHEQATNADISELLDHAHSSQTSKFLRDSNYVVRSGTGPSSRWRLKE